MNIFQIVNLFILFLNGMVEGGEGKVCPFNHCIIKIFPDIVQKHWFLLLYHLNC